MPSLVLENEKGPLRRRIYSLSAATLDDLPQAIATTSEQHFVLFLAWDAHGVPDETVIGFAQSLIRRGLAYIVAWGPDCERVHDLFDHVDIEENPEPNAPGMDTVIMSTWHDTESLEKALWFSLYSAYPASPYDRTTTATVAAAIASPAWGAAIHGYLHDLSSLAQAVGV
jgi:hypothetical protein